MADQMLTKQKLINGDQDLSDIEEVLNGPPGKLVKTRLGREVYTLASVPQINTMTREEVTSALAPKADKAETAAALDTKANQADTFLKTEVTSLVAPKADKTYVDTALVGFTNGASKFYPTLALATADIANITIKDKVDIGEIANGGSWYKATAGATSLTKSPYDVLQSILEMLNLNPLFTPKPIPSGTNVNTLSTGYWLITSDALAATLTGLPPQLTQPRRGYIFVLASGTTSYQKFTRDSSATCESYQRTGNGKQWGAADHAYFDWITADLTTLEASIKAWINLNPRFKSVNLTGTENFDTLPEGRYFIPTGAVATALDAQLPAAATVSKIGWIDKIYHSNAMIELVFSRYTSNPNGEYEIFRKRSNGGSSSLVWRPWQKDVSRIEYDQLNTTTVPAMQIDIARKPEINCFKNTKLTADGAFLHEATMETDAEGISVASLIGGKVSSVFYDYDVDGHIFVAGQSITLSAFVLVDGIGSGGGADISILAYDAAGAQVATTGSKYNTVASTWEKISVSLVLPANAVKFRVRFIRRLTNTFAKFKKPILVSSAWDATFINAFQTPSPTTGSNQFFVSKSGNNSNNGTKAFPKLTLQAAIDAIIASNNPGRATILDNGDYRESITNSSDLTIEIVSGRNVRASIWGSDQLVTTKTAGYSKIYQAPLAAKPVGMGGARGAPMIFEWGTPSSQVLDEDIHSLQRGAVYRCPYTPMLEATSLAELDTPTGNGKWWWESGIIYFSATDGSNATAKQYEARVRPCLTHTNGSMILKRIDSFFSNSFGMSFSGISTVREDCRVFGAYHNGFADNAHSTMSHRDMAVQNGNDGFNGTVSNYTGNKDAETSVSADYFNPYGALNGDDGLSFHIRGTCNIFGGLFEYNTKAGVVHVTGGGGNCYGTICRGQTNGFYTATASLDERNKSSMHCHNTIAEKNQYDYRAGDNAELYCVGTYSDNPTGYGYYQTGTGKIVCKDAKYRGDPSKMKYGNVIVDTYTQVT